MRKIAVFTTSDIQGHTSFVRGYLKNDDISVVSSIESYGEIHEYSSWGVLEKALAEGYTVFVVSSRAKIFSHDKWWVDLVGEENVCLANCASANDADGIERVSAFIEEKMGLECAGRAERKKEGYNFFGDSILNTTTWMGLLHDLEAFGVKDGHSFRAMR